MLFLVVERNSNALIIQHNAKTEVIHDVYAKPRWNGKTIGSNFVLRKLYLAFYVRKRLSEHLGYPVSRMATRHVMKTASGLEEWQRLRVWIE